MGIYSSLPSRWLRLCFVLHWYFALYLSTYLRIPSTRTRICVARQVKDLKHKDSAIDTVLKLEFKHRQMMRLIFFKYDFSLTAVPTCPPSKYKQKKKLIAETRIRLISQALELMIRPLLYTSF